MNYENVVEQWKYVTALPVDENGLTNDYEGVSFEEYRDSVLLELMMHEHGLRKYKKQINEDEEIAKELQDGNKSYYGTEE